MLLIDNQVLLHGWMWATFETAFFFGYHARTFASRQRADRARRSYGRSAWRGMEIVRV